MYYGRKLSFATLQVPDVQHDCAVGTIVILTCRPELRTGKTSPEKGRRK
jgi:hypothetical protein